MMSGSFERFLSIKRQISHNLYIFSLRVLTINLPYKNELELCYKVH